MSAIDRLDDTQRRKLDSLCASFAMEGQHFTDTEREVLALQILGDISRAEAVSRLDQLSSSN